MQRITGTTQSIKTCYAPCTGGECSQEVWSLATVVPKVAMQSICEAYASHTGGGQCPPSNGFASHNFWDKSCGRQRVIPNTTRSVGKTSRAWDSVFVFYKIKDKDAESHRVLGCAKWMHMVLPWATFGAKVTTRSIGKTRAAWDFVFVFYKIKDNDAESQALASY